jgi:nucleoside-diphosphate-sugar epimerase
VDESAPLAPADHVAWRPDHEQIVLDAGRNGLRTVVVRPGIVYGGSRGIVSDLLKDAMNGLVRVIGPGRNRWPTVYDRDLAELYVRLLQAADARGVFHASDEGDERVNDIVEAIAGHLTQRPDVRHMPLPEARRKLGPKADALALDQRVRSPRARALGWAPTLSGVTANIPRLFEEYRREKR